MKTKSGALILNKTERDALKVIKYHTLRDLDYGGGGSYSEIETDKNGNYVFDKKEAKKAKIGLEIIDFILEVTNEPN